MTEDSTIRKWLVFLGLLAGASLGLAGATFWYGRGHAYLTDDPQACAQCHIMKDQFDGWMRSSHRAVATCNSCHAPRGFLGKYATKAINGFNHSLAFTTGNFPEPIRIKVWNRRIAENNCIACHAPMWRDRNIEHLPLAETQTCTHCHHQVGHPH